ncbi:MAG: rod shape-determining protein RodA [Burkholderiales bacterium]|nr:rod shape-determining protein RodA [Burkholderiales bacterium]
MSELLLRFGRFLLRPLDVHLLALLGILSLIGLITLYSAIDESLARWSGQLLNFSAALLCMWLVAQISPARIASLALPLYVIGVLLLVAVAVNGDVVNGARRWLHVGVTRIQPSELVKLATPMMIAWYLHRHQEFLRPIHFIVAVVLLAVPLGLVLRQPDLGTAMLIGAAGFFVLFLAGLRYRVISVLMVLGLASLPVLWSFMHDYQRRRVLTLLDPSEDPLGAGYHTIQAMIAVGSGGITGKGWTNGTQSHLDFLPERHTDFIFAVFAEEFGMVGAAAMIGVIIAIVLRGLRIASNASGLFSRLMAGSLALSFFTYAFVNIGMVIGVLPVVGVPLPLVSYGGTSLVTMGLGFGILMSINRHRGSLGDR